MLFLAFVGGIPPLTSQDVKDTALLEVFVSVWPVFSPRSCFLGFVGCVVVVFVSHTRGFSNVAACPWLALAGNSEHTGEWWDSGSTVELPLSPPLPAARAELYGFRPFPEKT